MRATASSRHRFVPPQFRLPQLGQGLLHRHHLHWLGGVHVAADVQVEVVAIYL